MRIPCPLCGPRDRREFYCYGDAVYADRPAEGAGPDAWDAYLYLRDNPAGETRDLWFHELGCSTWVEVTRNTVTHEVLVARPVADRGRGAPGGSVDARKGPETGGRESRT
jgi:sarcosine oxidase subunit delta